MCVYFQRLGQVDNENIGGFATKVNGCRSNNTQQLFPQQNCKSLKDLPDTDAVQAMGGGEGGLLG